MKKKWVNPQVNVLGVSKTTDDITLFNNVNGGGSSGNGKPDRCPICDKPQNATVKHHEWCPNATRPS